MQAVKCPICNGNGLVSPGYYSHPGDHQFWVEVGVNPEQCRSCGGKGYLVISEESAVAPFVPSAPIWDSV